MILVHPLQGAFDRIDWAEKRMADLEGVIAAFGQRHADSVTVRLDQQEASGFRPIHPRIEIPSAISILVGEIIYNLRAALDYLVYELAILDSGKVQKKTQFLICSSKQEFSEQWCSRLKGINTAHVAAIEELQPYRRLQWMRWFQQISNSDKHCRLTERNCSFATVIGLDYRARDPAQRLFTSKLRAKGQDGTEVDVNLLTSLIVGLPIKYPRGEMAPPMEEALGEIATGVRSAVESFKGEFPGGH